MTAPHAGDGPLVLVVVQNLPLPGDRRVWLECRALRDAGYRVAAITPKGPGDQAYEEFEGIHLHKYRPAFATSGVLSFVWEFAYSWLMTAWLTAKVVRRHGRPAVMQACNPPDTYWLLGRVLRLLFRTRFVFDQHDLCPEVYESRFGARGPLHRALLLLERVTYATADHVIVTNESYRAVALGRGHQVAEEVTVVRTGPDTSLMAPRPRDDSYLRGRAHLVHFHGVMGPQDGVDLVLRTAAHVVHELGRDDITFGVCGKGDELARMRELCEELGLGDVVELPGRVDDDELFARMSTAVVGLSADPPGPLNDVSTMNKTMEYMALGLPVLAFDLPETRVSAGEAARYVSPATPEAYGRALVDLIGDAEARERMGEAGRCRAVNVLDWSHQRQAYVGVFDRLTRRQGSAASRPAR